MDFANKVVIVTGAARGIGKEIAITFAENGATTIVADIDIDKAKKVAEEFKFREGSLNALKVDVSSKEEVVSMVNEVVEQFSTIDILVNNAGICYIKSFEELTEAEWDRVMSINLKGVFLCCQAVFPVMKKKKKGSIINIASQAGKSGGLLVAVNYSASKAGVICLTKSLAKYSAQYGIRVNAVAPGLMDTEMTKDFPYNVNEVPLGRLGKPHDVAVAVKFLASEEAEYITGEILDVNGGILMD